MASLVVNRQVLLDALRRLSDQEREALLLVGWDGLDHTRAAVVAGMFNAGVHQEALTGPANVAHRADGNYPRPPHPCCGLSRERYD